MAPKEEVVDTAVVDRDTADPPFVAALVPIVAFLALGVLPLAAAP